MEEYKPNFLYKKFGKQTEFARSLRKHSTKAEGLLWECLRNRQLNGWKFRRQHPIKNYIVDFYCHELKLVVEIDGEIHDIPENKEYDALRTKSFTEVGMGVIRFTNNEVLNDIMTVLKDIRRIGNCYNIGK